MPIRKKLEDASVFRPAEIELLSRIFAETAIEGESAEERESRASRIIANYQLGIRDEKELIELSRRPLGR
ncbi:hypothetical protein [Mesorhizobium retamae]|uniref:Antitoxin VbhA domain-containing protein n=1 Tax=Mesorhizobium retamae TaxID=2912854 RepID=A0ABS9QLD8_9HYPH|nr:hypothetical protein [Mesorhizobium sp. IRAMC:0171]MCG7508263.1 hypothetical protein [Mesorhizobium sp. IRAMC:0171]